MAVAASVNRFTPPLPHSREIENAIIERANTLHLIVSAMTVSSDQVARAASIIIESLAAGGHVLTCGNGGSAAEAQHLSGELVGRFLREREPWPAIALTTDSSVLTALANDYGYDAVFARQVAAFGRPGDVLVAFSTSGESASVVNAAREARERGLVVIAFTGGAPSALARTADVTLAVPAAQTPIVQEVHAVLLHLICDVVESSLVATPVRKDMNR